MITELTAINKVLAAIGVNPVTTESSTHPDAIAARNTIESLSMSLQANGPEFNKDVRTLVRDNINNIRLPSNTLFVDSIDRLEKVTQRGGLLYNITGGTFEFDTDVVCDLVVYLDFNDLPFHASNYIMYTAAYDHYVDQDGDEKKSRRLEARKNRAQVLYDKTELNAKNINALHSPQAQTLLHGMGSASRNPNNIGGR